MKKKLLFALVLLSHQLSFAQATQDWINVNSPFVTPTPTPQLKPGGYLEIVFDLDRKPNPDPAAPNNWAPITDITAVSLTSEISLGGKTYKAEFPGVFLTDGKFKFKLYGPDFDQSLIINKTNWASITTRLNYKIKTTSTLTPESNFANAAFQSAGEGSVSVTRITYNLSTKEFVMTMVASSDVLKFSSTQILANSGGTVIGKFVKMDDDIQAVDNGFSVRITLKAEDGFDIIKIALANGGRVYAKVVAGSTGNPRFAEFSGLFPVAFEDDFEMSEVEGQEVFGLNEMSLKGTTSLPASGLKMVFVDNPFIDGNVPEIVGTQITRSSYKFTVPTSKVNFAYGQFQVRFEGKDLLGKTIVFNEKNPIKIKKSEIASGTTTIQQKDGKCDFSITFLAESPGDPKLVFVKSGDTRTLQKDGLKYSTTINLNDDAIKQNVEDVAGGSKILNVKVNAYGKDYNTNGIPVIAIDKDQAAKDLDGIKGRPGKKKEQIKKYLVDKEFVGNTEAMTEAIFAELSKDKDKRDWSTTWTNVGKFLKPAAGLLMLLL